MNDTLSERRQYQCATVCVLQVLSVAVNSGVVAYPVRFKSIYSSPKLSIWQPEAPEGYAAVGCLVTPDEEAPSVTDIGCLHRKVLVEAPLGQLLSLKPHFKPRQAGGSANDLVSIDSGHLDSHKQGYVWCVENCAASFLASADGHAPASGDLYEYSHHPLHRDIADLQLCISLQRPCIHASAQSMAAVQSSPWLQ